MSEHTKTPYKVDERVWIVGPDDNQAIIKCMGMDDSIREANAAFIVTACNAHDKLVEALTYLLNETEDYIKINHLSALHNKSLEMARTALALAQQGRP